MTIAIHGESKPCGQLTEIPAQARHFEDLSNTALWLSQFLRYGPLQATPAALPSGGVTGPVAASPLDLCLARCLSAHLRAEFTDTHWPDDWSRLSQEDITPALLAKLELVGRRRTFVGTCEICDSCPNQMDSCSASEAIEHSWNPDHPAAPRNFTDVISRKVSPHLA